MYSNCCGGYCGSDYKPSKKDKKAMLKEEQAILEAKLATVKHLIETADEDESDSEKS